MCQTSTACRSLSTAHGGNVAWLPINMTGFLARDTSSTPRWTDTHTHTQHAVDNPTTTATCHPNCHLAHSSTDSIYSSKWNLERNTSGLFSQPPLFTPSLPSLYLLLSPFLPFHLLALPFHFNHPPCLPLILPLPFSSPCYSLTPFTLTQPLPPHSFFYCPSTFLSHLPLSLTPSFLPSLHPHLFTLTSLSYTFLPSFLTSSSFHTYLSLLHLPSLHPHPFLPPSPLSSHSIHSLLFSSLALCTYHLGPPSTFVNSTLSSTFSSCTFSSQFISQEAWNDYFHPASFAMTRQYLCVLADVHWLWQTDRQTQT